MTAKIPNSIDELVYPISLDVLQTIGWSLFERLVVELIDAIFGVRMIIKPTRETSDGGRDGEGKFELLKNGPSELSFTMIVWVEVKQRNHDSLGAKEFGNTTFQAVIERVNKLILATNRRFSEPYLRNVEKFANQMRIEVGMLDGEKLVELLNKFQPTLAARKEKQEGSKRNLPSFWASIVSDPFGPLEGPTWDKKVEADQPIFIAIDAQTTEPGSNLRYRIEVQPRCGYSHWLRERQLEDSIMGPGKRRHVIPLTPMNAGIIRLADIATVKIQSIGRKVNRFSVGFSEQEIHIRRRPLPSVKLPYQERALNDLSVMLNRFTRHEGKAVCLIKARAGFGKTHVMRALRYVLIDLSIYEVWLDGETSSTASKIFRRIVRACFTVSDQVPSTSYLAGFKAWLAGQGFSADQIDSLAACIDLPEPESVQASRGTSIPELQIDALAAFLAKVAHARPIAILIEDLHKVSPSTIDALRSLIIALDGLGQSIALIMTTRPSDAVAGDDGNSLKLSDHLNPLEANKDVICIELEPKSEIEGNRAAHRLLHQAIPLLPKGKGRAWPEIEQVAARILGQAGTTPFSVKEAVLFLEVAGALDPGEEGDGTYVLKDRSILQLRIESNAIAKASINRLAAFFDQCQYEWLPAFLIAAALVGKRFPENLCLSASGQSEYDSLPGSALDNLLYWDILRLGGQDRGIRFSHDLLREAVLKLASTKYHATTKRVVAPGLFTLASQSPEFLGQDSPDRDLAMARLASVSDEAESAVAFTTAASAGFERQRRHLDSALAEFLWVELNSADLGQDLVSGSQVQKLFLRDPVLQYFPPHRDRGGIDENDLFAHLLRVAHGFLSAGIGASIGLDAVVAEIETRARRLGGVNLAEKDYLLGRLEFATDRFEVAARHHQSAVDRFNAVVGDKSVDQGYVADRLEINLDRLYLCLRQLERYDEARLAMKQWIRIRLSMPSSSFLQKSRLANRLGYHKLYISPRATMRLWRYQLRCVRRALDEERDNRALELGKERLASALIGTAIMEMAFDAADCETSPKQRLIEAEELLKEIQRRNLLIRVYMALANLSLIDGNLVSSRGYASEAESIAIMTGNVRRLWRTLAVRATVEESIHLFGGGSGCGPLAVELDKQVLALTLNRINAESSLGLDRPPWLHQRHAIGIVNVAVRNRYLIDDWEGLTSPVKLTLLSMADAIIIGSFHNIPRHLRGFFKNVPGVGLRGMVTE